MDATYKRILLGIGIAKREYANRLFQCLAASIRPLHVEELAEVLAIRLDAGEGSKYRADWRPEDARQAVLSACSSIITIVNVDGSPVVQFAHFSVKEFLMSSRLANAGEYLSLYHITPYSAHTVLARACLSVLLNFGDQVDKSAVEKQPFAVYAARYWVDHGKFEGVSSSIQDLMKRLFDPDRPYFATWVWIYDIDRPWKGPMVTVRPTQPEARPLYYAALCGFRSLVESLTPTHRSDVNTKGGSYGYPLQAALIKGEADIALTLLQNGANINAPDNSGWSPLHRAATFGHLAASKFLLEHRAEVNLQANDDCLTPLHLAALAGEVEICRLLLMHGADLDKMDVNQGTPLHFAFRSGKPEVARFLIEQGANAMSRDRQGNTSLHMASRQGHLDLVDMLLEGGMDVNARNAGEETPLNLVSGDGHLEVTRFLIERGADVNCCDKGETALHSAARSGHLDIVRLLLNFGIGVQDRTAEDETPLILASAGGHEEVSRFLIERQADVNSVSNGSWTSLHLASRNGHAGVVQLLLDYGADVNVQKADLWAPLHLASAEGYLKVAKLLIERGANVGVLNDVLATPLNLASGNGNLEVARLLIESGSDINSQDNTGCTAAHSAARSGHLSLIELLVDSGADVDVKNIVEKTPFDLAREHRKCDVMTFLARHSGTAHTLNTASLTLSDAGTQSQITLLEIMEPQLELDDGDSSDYEEINSLHAALVGGRIGMVRRLLNRGADVNERDELFRTPLHTASEIGKLDLARTLINYGADVDCRDAGGWTPLHISAKLGHIDVVQLLLDNGVDMNATEWQDDTALHLASAKGHFEIVQSLLKRGANARLRNIYGKTPSQCALMFGNGAIERLLSEYGMGKV